MEKINKKDYTTIQIRKKEYKKLDNYKEYESEPMWHVIKRIIEKGSLMAKASECQ